MKIVVLVSGGIDSALMISMFQKQGHEVFPIFINYNHLAFENEWKSYQKICERFSLIPYKMDILGFGELPSALTHKELDIYDEAFLPTRNLTFLTLAAAYAYSISSHVVSIGLLSNHSFPDQTKEFVKKSEISITEALGKKIHILTPLIDLDKRDVLRLAKEYDLEKITYFCHSGTEEPCGKCISCKERSLAEKELK